MYRRHRLEWREEAYQNKRLKKKERTRVREILAKSTIPNISDEMSKEIIRICEHGRPEVIEDFTNNQIPKVTLHEGYKQTFEKKKDSFPDCFFCGRSLFKSHKDSDKDGFAVFSVREESTTLSFRCVDHLKKRKPFTEATKS
jgi:hypothetical protein